MLRSSIFVALRFRNRSCYDYFLKESFFCFYLAICKFSFSDVVTIVQEGGKKYWGKNFPPFFFSIFLDVSRLTNFSTWRYDDISWRDSPAGAATVKPLVNTRRAIYKHVPRPAQKGVFHGRPPGARPTCDDCACKFLALHFRSKLTPVPILNSRPWAAVHPWAHRSRRSRQWEMVWRWQGA